MGYRDATAMYKNNQILTASPKRLIELLYEGAIKNIKLAELALDTVDFESVNRYSTKAQSIILELKNALNPTAGGEITEQLNQIYDFMFERLVSANIEKQPEKFELVRKMLEELKTTWNELEIS
ncbi:flagellar export chaperone FliS [Vagococcus salmoninarum]|uniref:Flagellar export chaperone FliS n=1 Tax=Vagococcus salmoninarum TaxID=2739 RepID=A0A429ZSQ3_9ENTE|nr:flagellar export chaperone FliS [Vagococcus salmoninarum]RST96775.1 flagellar export chaperone FliS [Vagococcus salmoninarum]